MMTFKEWVESYETTYETELDEEEIHSAQQAWDNSGIVHTAQATAAERGAAASRAWESMKQHAHDLSAKAALDIFNAIRETDDGV